MSTDETAERSRQKHAEKNAAENGADDAAAVLRRSEMRGKRDEHVHRRAHEPDAKRGEREPESVAGESCQHESDDRSGQHPGDQGTALVTIAERDEEQHAKTRSNLRGHGDCTRAVEVSPNVCAMIAKRGWM